MPRVYIRDSNLHLHYDVHGVGRNKIVFVMGLTLDGEQWGLQTDYLLVHHPEYQCVTYDHRGIGKSSLGNAWRHTTSLMASDVLALVDHLGWDKFHLVGISMGGMISIEFAIAHPERILSLSLMSTHAGGFPMAMAPIHGVVKFLQSMSAKTDQERIQHGLALLYGQETLQDPVKRAKLTQHHSEKWKNRKPKLLGVIAQILAIPSHYVSYSRLLRLRYCPFPTLVLVGTDDSLVREENSNMIARVICATKFVIVPGAGHAPCMSPEECDIVNKELLAIFKRGEELTHLDQADQIKYRRHLECLDKCCKHHNSCFLHIAGNAIKGASVPIILGLLYRFNMNNAYMHNGMDVNPMWRYARMLALFRCGITSFTCFYHSLRAFLAFRKLGAKPPRGHDNILDEREIISSQHYWFPISPIFYLLASIVLARKYYQTRV